MKKIVLMFLISIVLALSACVSQPLATVSPVATPPLDLMAGQMTSIALIAGAGKPAAVPAGGLTRNSAPKCRSTWDWRAVPSASRSTGRRKNPLTAGAPEIDDA